MTSLFQQIESTQKLPGWCSLEKANALASMVVALRPAISIEAGIFGGRSFLPIALAHKYIGYGMAIGVEPWSKSAAVEGYSGINETWWGNINMEGLRAEFLNQIHLLAVNNVSRIIRKKFQEFIIPDGIGLFHLDSQHSDKTMDDVKRIVPKLLTGGILVLDDCHWINDGNKPVNMAASWLLIHGFRELYRVFNKPEGPDDWAVFQKVL